MSIISCKKGDQNSQWNADELVPLIKTSVNLYDLSNYDELNPDSSGALMLTFSNSLFKFSLDSLVSIPDTAISERIDTLIFVSFAPGFSVDLAQNQETMLKIGNTELVEAIINSGSIDVTIKSTFSEPTIVSYELSSATKNGNKLVISESIPAGSVSSPSVISASYNLSNYYLDLKGLNGNSYNTLVAQISAMVDPSGDTLVSQLNDYIEISYTFNNIQPKYARGYFGDDSYSNLGREEFHFLSNFTGGDIDIESLNMNFEIINGAGVDIQIDVNTISMSNIEIGRTSVLNSIALANSLNIDRAQETGVASPPIIASSYSIGLDNNNSNVDKLFEIIPNQIDYGFDLQINPFGHISSHNDFIYKDFGIEVLLDMEIPMSVATNEFTLSDTVEFDMGEKTIDDRYLIIDGFIHLYAYNWYPFTATTQLYLLDESYAIIDSILVENSIVEAGILDNYNVVVSPKRSKISGVINTAKIDALYNARYIKTDFTLTTPDYPDYVQVYDYYKIDMTLVGDFNYVIDPNE
ncbi:MAG: hypothetical protein HOB26_05645 [Flavobacteriales bacterium]|nr:hypothetical protein [Flavobacteriales bacterium]